MEKNFEESIELDFRISFQNYVLRLETLRDLTIRERTRRLPLT